MFVSLSIRECADVPWPLTHHGKRSLLAVDQLPSKLPLPFARESIDIIESRDSSDVAEVGETGEKSG